ncbi:MAG: hypothetical protein AAF213_13780, partial [Pseudomonadota bacterium]
MNANTVNRLLSTVALVALVGCATAGPGSRPVVGDLVGPRAEFEGPPIRPTAAGHYLAGHLAQGAGDWSSAAAFMNTALDKDPSNNQLLRRAFLLSAGSGAFDAALNQANQIAALEQPLDLALVMLLADAARQEDTEAAAALFDRISDDGLQRVLKPGVQAWVLAAQGERDQALSELEGFRQFGGFEALIALHRAFILEYIGDVETAEVEYQQAVELSPTLRAGQAYGGFLARQGRVAEAIDVYDDYFARDGSSLLAAGVRRLKAMGTPPPGFDSFGDGIGSILFDFASVLQGDLGIELTMVLVQIATYASPDFPLAQLLLADLLAERDQFEEAAAAYLAIA